ncbi:histidine phosphatase family protein, partial [Salmonella enterica subsp. enterica serovar Typhimurium]
NATGVEQAHHALDSTPAFAWDGVMSSPLIRARLTAEVIATDHSLPLIGVHEGFREVDFGWAEGKPSVEAYAAYPERDFPG